MLLSERIIGWFASEGTRAALFAFPLVILGSLLAATSVVAWNSQEQELRLNRAYLETTEFLDVTYAAEHATLQIIRGQRGYLLTSDPKYLVPYREGRAELAQSLASLHAFAKTDHGKLKNVRLMNAHSDTYVQV